MSSQQFCLKNNDHRSAIGNRFSGLLRNGSMVDVTLVCDSVRVKAHKIVLAACCPYFQEIFEENPCKHPVVIFKGFCSSQLRLVIQFIYEGTVNIDEQNVKGFMDMAKNFQVIGLETAELDRVSNENCYPLNIGIDKPASRHNSVSDNARPEGVSAIQLGLELPEELGIACNTMQQSTIKSLPLTSHTNNATVTAEDAVLPSEMNEMIAGLIKLPIKANARPADKKNFVQLTFSKKKQILDLRYNKLMSTQEISAIVNISNERVINFLDRNLSFTSVPAPAKRLATLKKKNKLKKTSISDAKVTGVQLPLLPNTLTFTTADPVSTSVAGPSSASTSLYSVTGIATTAAITDASTSSEQRGINGTSASPGTKIIKMSYSRLTEANQKRVLDLYADKKMTPDEIGLQLNLPVSKVREYVNRLNGDTVTKSKNQKMHKLDAKSEARLMQMIRSKATITQAQIQSYIKKKFGISKSILAIRKLLLKHNLTTRRPLPQNYQSLNAEQEKQLVIICNNTKITRAQIQQHVKKEYNLSISKPYISRFLKKYQIGLRRSLPDDPMPPVAQNSLSNIEARYEHAVNMTELRTRRTPFVFVDECTIGIKSKGESAPPELTEYYVLAAVNVEKGLLRKVYQKKAFNGENFLVFLEQVQLLLPAVRHAFVMSNTTLHRAEKVKQWLHHKGHEHVLLPSSSPFLNPLDKLFKKLRAAVRRFGADDLHQKFGQQLQECFAQVTKEVCCIWIQSTFEYFPQCLLRTPILNTTLAVGTSSSQESENDLPVTMENDRKSMNKENEQNTEIVARENNANENVFKHGNPSSMKKEPVQEIEARETSMAVPANELLKVPKVEIIDIDD